MFSCVTFEVKERYSITTTLYRLLFIYIKSENFLKVYLSKFIFLPREGVDRLMRPSLCMTMTVYQRKISDPHIKLLVHKFGTVLRRKLRIYSHHVAFLSRLTRSRNKRAVFVAANYRDRFRSFFTLYGFRSINPRVRRNVYQDTSS